MSHTRVEHIHFVNSLSPLHAQNSFIIDLGYLASTLRVTFVIPETTSSILTPLNKISRVNKIVFETYCGVATVVTDPMIRESIQWGDFIEIAPDCALNRK